jgi:hypothetical protein
LGEAEGVDVVIDAPGHRVRIQAKRRKNIAKYLSPGADVDAVVVREDRGDALAVLPLDALLSLLTASGSVKDAKEIRSNADADSA